jgi:hypothetical protein
MQVDEAAYYLRYNTQLGRLSLMCETILGQLADGGSGCLGDLGECAW